MSKQLYKRYLKLVSQWPKDKYKNPDRDLANFLSKQVEKYFAPSVTPTSSIECERRLQALEHILSNKWSTAYPHKYTSGAWGMRLEKLEEATSDECRSQLGLAPKTSLWRRAFSLLPSKNVSRSYSTGGEGTRMGAVLSVIVQCASGGETPDPGGGAYAPEQMRHVAGIDAAAIENGSTAGEALKKTSGAKASIVFTRAEADRLHGLTSILRDGGAEIVDEIELRPSAVASFLKHTGHATLPLAFVKGCAVGGEKELRGLAEGGRLAEWLKDHQYDLVVIGGGSGGLAAAKEAAGLGWKVACLDFVQPSPLGTTWGLGGTCVNVGCIPKKLMHQASLLGHSVDEARAFGWKVPPKNEIGHDWKVMRQNIQDYIGSLNWGYRVQLREKTVEYLNSYGVFTGSHEITATDKKGKQKKLTADRFLVATGLRPRYPDIPGAKEYCITSDDLFSLSYSPGKTLCVGASYVSLECAGFLHGVGYDVTVMVRSILLRGFDQDMAERIRKQMTAEGIKFVNSIPTRVEEIEPRTKEKAGRLRVFFNAKKEDGTEEETSEEYDTVLIAIGRDAVTKDLGLDHAGVQMDKAGKVVGRPTEQSVSSPYVFAVGDVLSGCPELTPVAIHAGRALMRRLHGKLDLTEYDAIPTTVFTPLEYGCCGLSEEAAIAQFGKEDVVVYHNVFFPLEYTVPERKDKEHCYLKLICRASDKDRIVGFHILCPSAGEVTQGFGIALKMGATKEDLDRLIGIHPTVAENFTSLTLVKKEGDEELKATGC